MKSKPKVRWILFDLDGTLADSLDAMVHVYGRFLRQFGFKGTKKEFQELNGRTLPEIVVCLKKRYGLSGTCSTLVKIYKKSILEVYRREIKPFAAAPVILEKLNRMGYGLVLVTSADKSIAWEFIRRYRWGRHFKYYVFGNEVRKAKPHPAIYRKAMRKAGTASAVVVEDSVNGIKAALAAGAFVIGIGRSRRSLLGSGANAAVTALQDVPEVLP
jgi:HAD superfamily hydrolase (TIGR01509 family)